MPYIERGKLHNNNGRRHHYDDQGGERYIPPHSRNRDDNRQHGKEESFSQDYNEEIEKARYSAKGVVFLALFNTKESGEFLPKEEAAVIKIASCRMATQSERLGCEFAKWLGVRSLQARVIHNRSLYLMKYILPTLHLSDEVGEVTCLELLKALELSRCLYLMNYAHGSPLLENSSAFKIKKAAEKTSAALGRILMLDLVIRNKDRLPCCYLQWRGNSTNLLLADKMATANHASNLLHEITTGKLGVPPEAIETSNNLSFIKDMNLVALSHGIKMAGLFDKQAEVADHYTQVIGTDISEHQLKLAKPHPRVRYLHTPLSLSGDDLIDLLGGESSVDLVTVAEAVHWFYDTTLPYWNKDIKYLSDGYQTLPFPFESVGLGSEGSPLKLDIAKELSFEGVLGFLRSWSAIVTAKEKGVDLLSENVVQELKSVWDRLNSRHYNIYHYPQRHFHAFPGDMSLGILIPGDMSPEKKETKNYFITIPGDMSPGKIKN
ncbi:dual specificity protein phosphatase PHS1 [Tanacetum coccineum]